MNILSVTTSLAIHVNQDDLKVSQSCAQHSIHSFSTDFAGVVDSWTWKVPISGCVLDGT